eukprot:GFYU01006057.1.p1 GENE.GFYU01006057.1~~GFYU01006057.1.p1  ORF type:complete len:382 (+),score=78.77 GFYU01006057.1:113-1258(+)
MTPELDSTSDASAQEFFGIPKEREDTSDVLSAKLDTLWDLCQEAKSIMVFTGAGISTAADIPDYRGENGLYMKQPPLVCLGLAEQKTLDFVMPTYSHVAIAQLAERGIVNYVATSNHDGLHEKAGMPDDVISNVFGCVYVEKCRSCKALYTRKVIVPTLGRVCDDPTCGGQLQKTGTRMGAETPAEPLHRAQTWAQNCDLAIVLGSSMTIQPFCHIPGLCKKMAIVTLQPTEYDRDAAVKIHAKCDDVMKFLLDRYTVTMQPLTYAQVYTVYVSQEPLGANTSINVTVKGTPDRPSEPPTCVDTVTVTQVEGEGRSTDLEKNRKGMFEGSLTVTPLSHLHVEIHFAPSLEVESVTHTFALLPTSDPEEQMKQFACTKTLEM